MKTANLFCLALFVIACQSNPPSETTAQPAAPSPETVVARGQYLVTVMGCHDCHSPKRMGAGGPELIPELLLSGYPADRPVMKVNPALLRDGQAVFNADLTAAAGPWGMSFAANLTSDPTGIGNWTEENFKRALKEGKFKGSPGARTLLPPMPWTNFLNIEDEDVHAIFMYLKSTDPVRNVVPQPIEPAALK
jgi:hypothetical protein